MIALWSSLHIGWFCHCVTHFKIYLSVYWWQWIKSPSLHGVVIDQQNQMILLISGKDSIEKKHWEHMDYNEILYLILYLSVKSLKCFRFFSGFELFINCYWTYFHYGTLSVMGKKKTNLWQIFNFHSYLDRKYI